MEAATIKLFLVQGKPNGLRVAELSNWSGKSIAAPRSELSALLKRDELNRPGLYILTGIDPETDEKAIYIGETENILTRLKEHHIKKDFWNAVTVFVSKDDNLTKAHIKYLEGCFIELANNTNSFVVMNLASSGAKLPECDAAEMDVFLQKSLQLLPVLGIVDFNQTFPKSSNKKDEFLHYEIKDQKATGKVIPEGFVIFAESQAVLELCVSAGTTLKKQRKKLIKKGYLKQQENGFIFTKDTTFGSPSAAASIVSGGNTNGRTTWKNSEGKNINEIIADKN